MDDGHIIYCVSNASVDYFKNNKLTEFSNFLPINFGIDKSGWEIGVAAFGLHLNVEKDSEKNVIQIKSDVVPSFNLCGYPCFLVHDRLARLQRKPILLPQRGKHQVSSAAKRFDKNDSNRNR